LIEYAFNELGIQKLVAETQTANIRSCKLLEKVGMIMEQRIIRFGAEQAVYSIQKMMKGPSFNSVFLLRALPLVRKE
jgi:[ribosomal protein S5]-alanine N-acetyltransferase